VSGGVKVLGGVFPGGAVTAAYMAAAQTEPEVDPAAASLEAFLAAVRCVWLQSAELRDMRTTISHDFLSALQAVRGSHYPQVTSKCAEPDLGINALLTHQRILIHYSYGYSTQARH
jgi:hypothetical protein